MLVKSLQHYSSQAFEQKFVETVHPCSSWVNWKDSKSKKQNKLKVQSFIHSLVSKAMLRLPSVLCSPIILSRGLRPLASLG